MVEKILAPPVARAHSQTQVLVELLLQDRHDEVRELLSELPAEDVVPLLGAALIYAAETMRTCWGRKGALKRIAKARQAVGQRGGLHG